MCTILGCICGNVHTSCWWESGLILCWQRLRFTATLKQAEVLLRCSFFVTTLHIFFLAHDAGFSVNSARDKRVVNTFFSPSHISLILALLENEEGRCKWIGWRRSREKKKVASSKEELFLTKTLHSTVKILGPGFFLAFMQQAEQKWLW